MNEGDYLDSADLMASEKPIFVTIKKVINAGELKNASGEPIKKPVLEFEETPKKLILCRTNEKIIKSVNGNIWTGKKIGLEVRYLERSFHERNVPCIRVSQTPGKVLPFACRKHYGQPKPFKD
jgi:hypothetical protein